jgi:lysophospholipase L1-like esterase
MINSLLNLLTTLLALTASAFGLEGPSFAEFDRRANAGERLHVVFFGASLTWGANATDPQLTSCRARIAQQMEAIYPRAHFTFHDAAIGGTGWQLGVFRLERDVLRHQPDLVFLDFSANDDITTITPETLASYESLMRRIITDAHAPLVQMIFPFGWNVQSGDFANMKRRTAHRALASAYHAPVGDAIALAVERVNSGTTTLEKLWPNDWVHPGDAGYQLFADAGWAAFQDGVKRQGVCVAPAKMLYADTYLKHARVRISTLGDLPAGWRRGTPNLTSAYFDMLMSRWLDDEVIASNRIETTVAGGGQVLRPQAVARLTLRFRGTMVMLFGEGTLKSGKYRAYIDGKPVARMLPNATEPVHEFDSASLSTPSNGNTHHTQIIAENLDANTDHTLEIEPLFMADQEQELRLESICVAGGDAKVFPIQSK